MNQDSDIFALNDQIALVTGASRGIGRAIAETLAAHGAQIILVSRKQESLEAVARAIVEQGGRAHALACHTGDMKAIADLFKRIGEKFGRLDILVNNAATNPFFGEMIQADERAWDKTMGVNLKGPFFMIQHAARLMKKGQKGAIVNVASVNAIQPAPFQGIYSISKAALVMLTKAYAKELASYTIRVNALLPGLTDTRFAQAIIQDEAIRQFALGQIPMQRIAQPMEMAGAVLYLVSDAAAFTTGACITCDGGQTI